MGLGTKSATGTRSALGAKGATLGVSLVGRRGDGYVVWVLNISFHISKLIR